MRPRWRAFGILSGLMIALILILISYMASMGYFELDTQEEIWTHAYDGVLELDVSNDIGSVEVDPWDGSTIEIVGIKKTYFGDEELDKIELRLTEEDGLLKISTKRDRDATWVWMDLRISIPAGMNVSRIDVDIGKIDLKGISGDTEVSNSAGSIRIDGAENITRLRSNVGEVILKNILTIDIIETDAGSIDIENVGEIGEITSDSSEIKIINVDRIGYISNDGGEIELDDCGTVERVRCSSGDIDLVLSTLSEVGLDVTTDNGDIDVTLPPNTSADFELLTDNGDTGIEGFTNTSFSEQSKDTKRGTTGIGGPLIRLETDNGDVDLWGRG